MGCVAHDINTECAENNALLTTQLQRAIEATKQEMNAGEDERAVFWETNEMSCACTCIHNICCNRMT